MAESFRRACAGEVEESMFFWRAVNAEVWLRVYIDGKTRALDEHSYEGGFVRRGDAATAKKVANGEALLDGARLNWGRHLFLEDQGPDLGTLPVAFDIHQARRSIFSQVDRRQPRSRSSADGVDVEDGDVLLISEKALGDQPGPLVSDR